VRNKHLIKFAEKHGITKQGLFHGRAIARVLKIKNRNSNKFWQERILFAEVFNRKIN